VKRFDHALRAELVDEAEPDAEADDREDDHRVGVLADRECNSRRGAEEDQQRVAQLPDEDGQGAHVVGPNGVWAKDAEPRRGLRQG
jgi:hypothetical protein